MTIHALTELVTLLDEQIRLHASLRTDLEREAAEDGEMDSSALIAVQQRKYHALEEIVRLEEQRMDLVRALATDWGEPVETLRLKAIAARVPEPLDAELRRCHETLMEQIMAIRELANRTAQNAAARLKAVDATLAVIQDAVHNTHTTYSDAGRMKRRAPSFKYTAV